ncbi:hypothetical protein [Streptomyces erythrochromogenes]|uniref:hypothetical protein n=1 Tax=Streptomyces erythrochromogenes TaxID=285574 RepID=UPI003700C204
MSTSAPPEQVFRPERHLNHLVVFRPLEFLPEWDEGFGKLKPAVVTEWAVLSRGTAKPGSDELVMTLVEEPEVRLETVKHAYLVQVLRDSVGGVVAAYVGQAGTSFVLEPPPVSEYGRIYRQCEGLSRR